MDLGWSAAAVHPIKVDETFLRFCFSGLLRKQGVELWSEAVPVEINPLDYRLAKFISPF